MHRNPIVEKLAQDITNGIKDIRKYQTYINVAQRRLTEMSSQLYRDQEYRLEVIDLNHWIAHCTGMLNPIIELVVEKKNFIERIMSNSVMDPNFVAPFNVNNIEELIESHIEFMRLYGERLFALSANPPQILEILQEHFSRVNEAGHGTNFTNEAQNLNINSNDDAIENDLADYEIPLLPGEEVNNDDESEIYTSTEKHVKQTLEEYDELNFECLDLKEDSRQIYESIEAIIPFHEERIVTRSVARKLGENGIETFDLEVQLESNLQKKRKNLAKKQELANHLVTRFLPDNKN